MSKLWIKHGKQLVLSGVQIEGNIIRDEEKQFEELGKFWQPTFDAKPFV